MSSWQPQQEGLGELIQLFRESQSMEAEVQVHIADVRCIECVMISLAGLGS